MQFYLKIFNLYIFPAQKKFFICYLCPSWVVNPRTHMMYKHSITDRKELLANVKNFTLVNLDNHGMLPI